MKFNDCGYQIIRGAISTEMCEVFSTYALLDEKINPNFESRDVPNTHFKTADLFTTSLLLNLQPFIESLVESPLRPTSSHFRVYRRGSKLLKHHDQPECCEVTASITMGASLPEGYKGWPVYLEDEPFYLGVTDMLLFKGSELMHYRPLMEVPHESYQIQIFIHYIRHDSKIIDEYRGLEGIGFYDN